LTSTVNAGGPELKSILKCKYSIVSPIGGFGNHLRWLALLDSKFTSNSPSEQVDYILSTIYFVDRTWHNWLIVEWNHRNSLNKKIYFSHNNLITAENTIFLKADPELAYKSYLKFNSNLNNESKNQFLRYVNNFSNVIGTSNNTVLDSTKLFTETLDRDLYTQLITAFDLDDNYESAQIIHSRWYQLHKQAEIDIINDLTEIYK